MILGYFLIVKADTYEEAYKKVLIFLKKQSIRFNSEFKLSTALVFYAYPNLTEAPKLGIDASTSLFWDIIKEYKERLKNQLDTIYSVIKERYTPELLYDLLTNKEKLPELVSSGLHNALSILVEIFGKDQFGSLSILYDITRQSNYISKWEIEIMKKAPKQYYMFLAYTR